ncbi:hypothetical protein GCM10023189_53240 [Nibrella saemangeumensis]|uniref:Uncharacterized protein n=1 Tax=Nibrella saemangeumensis TaxID=1084526 RepID=A0ABP8NME1_9BACT
MQRSYSVYYFPQKNYKKSSILYGIIDGQSNVKKFYSEEPFPKKSINKKAMNRSADAAYRLGICNW